MMTELAGLHIDLAGLRIWIHRRQFPDSEDYWDGNWLRVTAECQAPGTKVRRKDDPCIHLSELSGWYEAARDMNATLSGKALLQCMEPYVSVNLVMNSRGRIDMEVHITPDHLTQRHMFKFAIDQSYLPPFLAQCKAVIDEYPLKGQPPTGSAEE